MGGKNKQKIIRTLGPEWARRGKSHNARLAEEKKTPRGKKTQATFGNRVYGTKQGRKLCARREKRNKMTYP